MLTVVTFSTDAGFANDDDDDNNDDDFARLPKQDDGKCNYDAMQAHKEDNYETGTEDNYQAGM